MQWNWQQRDWPYFTWNAGLLSRAEERFLKSGGVLLGSVKHLGDEERSLLNIEVMSAEAVTTSAIEGETLDRASIQSSLQRQLGLLADPNRTPPKEQGIAEMMVSLFRSFDAPLSDEVLFEWHQMVMKGGKRATAVGTYRSGAEPMQVISGQVISGQVISGQIDSPRVHFEAPPSSQVPAEMRRFIEWFNRTSPGGADPRGALTRAGIAHLYFESIHPFEDGNGRIGRGLSEKALAQSLGLPALVTLAPTILSRKAQYYDALEAASTTNEVSDWLRWFAGVVLEAQSRCQANVEFIIHKAKLLDRLRGDLNPRQEKALMRMFREGPAGFKGGLSAGNYMTITGASAATTTRDLVDLTAKRALVRVGELKSARYHLEIPTPDTSSIVVAPDGSLLEG